jgi:hypothetical protein
MPRDHAWRVVSRLRTFRRLDLPGFRLARRSVLDALAVRLRARLYVGGWRRLNGSRSRNR